VLSLIKIEEIFNRFKNFNPSPKIELDYHNHYSLLIAVVLSAQSTDKAVNTVTKELFKVADTPEKMIQLGEERLKTFIKKLGLYNNKAKNIILLSTRLVEHFNSIVPNDSNQLQSLPGVGRKSANVILNSLFDKLTIGVDTHVFRTANRIGLCSAKNVLATEKTLDKIIPSNFKKHAHHWLVLHGRYICKSRKPECKKCIINDICLYEKKS